MQDVILAFVIVGFGLLMLGSYISYRLPSFTSILGILGAFSLLVGFVLAVIEDITYRRRKKKNKENK